MIYEITKDLESPDVSRRRLCCMIGGAAATLMVGAAVPATAATGLAEMLQGLNDGDVLNFALNLEYLEAEFYSMATTGNNLGMSDITGMGDAGHTRGGAKVSFTNPALADLAHELAADELAHVRFLRGALKKGAVAKPEINLDALGLGFANDQEFLTLARAFEDVGASAYRSAAKLLRNKDYLDAAAGILATEAYHGGCLRAHIIYANATVPSLDAMDVPPTRMAFFPTDASGLVIGRDPGQVGMIVRGANPSGGAFYPRGLNGKVR